MQKQWNKVKWWKYPKCLVTTLLKIRMNSNFSKFVSTFILLLIVEYGGMYPSPMFKWQKWLDWENKLGYIKFSVLRFLLKLKKLCNPPSWLLESKLHAPTQTFLKSKVKDIFTIVGVWAWQFSSFCELEFAATGKWSSLHYPINYLLKATYATTLHTYYDYKITYLVKIWPVDIEKKLDLVMTAFLSFNLTRSKRPIDA